MTLPRKPGRSQPIPNQPFESPEVTTIRGPYWDMPLGPGLEADSYGSVQTAGSDPSAPSAYLYGSNGLVGLGTGLQLGPNGELEQGGGYIYCTPQFPELPVTYPPYGCNTTVNTAGVTNLTEAWNGCTSLTSFPCIDTSSAELLDFTWSSCTSLTSFPKLNTSSVYSFFCTWQVCSSLTSFPKLNTSSGQMFGNAWNGCSSLTSFPTIDVSGGTFFGSTWSGCSSLTSFPPLDFSSGTVFSGAWQNCFNLTEFPAGVFDYCPGTMFLSAWAGCALNQTSVDNILVSINTAGQSNGTLGLNGGTSSAPGAAGLSAKAALQARGWTVLTN